MNLQPLEQAAAQINQSRTPVIIIPPEPSSDAIAGALGLLLLLEKMGKKVKVVSPDFALPPSHTFLPKSQAIGRQLTNLQSFVITLNLKQAKPESLSYDIHGDSLSIFITPKNGTYHPNDVSTSDGSYAYDLIITLDLPTLEKLGALYEQNSQFFYHTPIINIDHHPTNGRYGHIQVIEVTATSVSEIVFELIKHLGQQWLDEQVATNLLTGIISKTKAFQNQAVTPRSLAVASHLMTAGARRDEIIKNLYQSKSVRTLQLWGRALTRLESNTDGSIMWTSVTAKDLQELKASPQEAAGVLDELMVNAPQATYTILFVEFQGQVEVHLNHQPGATVPTLPPGLEVRGPDFHQGILSGSLTQVSSRILAVLGEPSVAEALVANSTPSPSDKKNLEPGTRQPLPPAVT